MLCAEQQRVVCYYFFFFNDAATTGIYTLSLPDALPIWGYTVNKNIGYGYVRNPEGVDSEYFISGTYELEVATVRHSCKLQLGPLYDPKLERVRK